MGKTTRMDIEDVLQHFDQLEDPRSSINRQHPLSSVVLLALMGIWLVNRPPRSSQNSSIRRAADWS